MSHLHIPKDEVRGIPRLCFRSSVVEQFQVCDGRFRRFQFNGEECADGCPIPPDNYITSLGSNLGRLLRGFVQTDTRTPLDLFIQPSDYIALEFLLAGFLFCHFRRA